MHFSKNDSFSLDGEEVKILSPLGEGGQGEVYLVQKGNDQFAFKYYKETPSEDFRYNLKNNIAKGSPSSTFLWPKQIVEFNDDTLGYIMDLRPSRFVSFVSYLTGKYGFSSKRAMLSWCIDLVKSFKKLHEHGFSYQDLNDGSFFLDPNDGSLLICDNDNVTADKTNLGVLGKMRYMAPEIVRGDKDRRTGQAQMPDTHSDRFSLAIILFLALTKGNPFEGEVLKKYVIIDEKADYEMFGSHPVYIYNQNDASNRPIRGYHTTVLKRYPELPSYIKAAFHKTFVDGLTDRENGRTTEIEWLKLLCRYRDELLCCECGNEYIVGYAEKHHNDKCPHCKKPTKQFATLTIGRNKIALEPDKYLYKFHLDKYSDEYNIKVGKVIKNKANPALWGIKLKLAASSEIVDKTGQSKVVAPDGVIPIVNNLTIKFPGDVIGEINVEAINQ